MVKKKKHIAKKSDKIISLKKTTNPAFWAFVGFTFIAVTLTFPLILRMNSSVYGFYDHISTDLFAAIHNYFWWIKYAVINLKVSPIMNPLSAAPFGSRMNFINFTGFAQLPITVLFGHLFSRNFVILFNLIVSALGMFYLIRFVTDSSSAGFIAGIIYAFCPIMMVRSYTTFDSTQIQWIPFYTLYILKFIDHRTWKNALLSGLFLICNILFAMPYYLLYLPVHTITLLLVYAGWYVWGKKEDLVKDLTTPEAVKAWTKIAVSLGLVIVVFAIYYTTIVGGSEFTSNFERTPEDLEQLSLKPTDYLMPHPRSAFIKGNIKESYWNAKRPGKDPDSFTAYIGYIALVLAVFGVVKGRRGVFKWIFLATALIAFWSTLGPRLLGIPTPSGLIYILYARFARRILIYNVFVQIGIAGLAGMGAAFIFNGLPKLIARMSLLVLLTVLIIFEYTLVPPALSVDLRYNPEIYDRVKELPDEAILIEVPLRRNNGNLFQGYEYYQMYHHKKLFNEYFSLSQVPEHIQPFYKQMEVPLEAQSFANLAALRYLGITHLTYHRYIGTTTVRFGSFAAPGLATGNVEGLKTLFTCDRHPDVGPYPSPFDYTFADLYEITAEPCPVALTFHYQNPYQPIEGLLSQDGLLPWGWASALIDTTKTFYYPVADGERLVRLLRQGGRVTTSNMSGEPVEFSIAFMAESPDSNRVIEVKWNNGPFIGQFEIGPEPDRCIVQNLHLDAQGKGELSIWSTRDAFFYGIDYYDPDGRKANVPATAVLSDFRVKIDK